MHAGVKDSRDVGSAEALHRTHIGMRVRADSGMSGRSAPGKAVAWVDEPRAGPNCLGKGNCAVQQA